MAKEAASSYHSVSCRPIENGHLVSESHEGPDGYTHREYFSKEPLDVSSPTGKGSAPPKSGPSSLSKAVSLLRGRK